MTIIPTKSHCVYKNAHNDWPESKLTSEIEAEQFKRVKKFSVKVKKTTKHLFWERRRHKQLKVVKKYSWHSELESENAV